MKTRPGHLHTYEFQTSTGTYGTPASENLVPYLPLFNGNAMPMSPSREAKMLPRWRYPVIRHTCWLHVRFEPTQGKPRVDILMYGLRIHLRSICNEEVEKLREQLEECKDVFATICLKYHKGIKPEDRVLFIKAMVTFSGSLYLKLEASEPENFDS